MCLKALRAQLPEGRLAAARSEGAQLSLEDAIQLGNRPLEPHSSSRTPLLTPLKAAKVQYGGLTAREREVAACVACGKTNREIAAELVVTERTVEAHVGNILSKLEFTSRTQICAWAAQKGLVAGGRV